MVASPPDDMNTPGLKSSCHARSNSAYVEDGHAVRRLPVEREGDPRMVMVAARIAGDPTPVGTVLAPLVGDGTLDPHARELVPTRSPAPAPRPEVADPAVRDLAVRRRISRSQRVGIDLQRRPLAAAHVTIGESAKQVIGDPCLTAVLADNSPGAWSPAALRGARWRRQLTRPRCRRAPTRRTPTAGASSPMPRHVLRRRPTCGSS